MHVLNISLWLIGHFRVLLCPCQNKFKCETFLTKMSSACSFIFMQIKVIFTLRLSFTVKPILMGTLHLVWRKLNRGTCSRTRKWPIILRTLKPKMFILHGRLSQEFGTYTKHGPGSNKGGWLGGGDRCLPDWIAIWKCWNENIAGRNALDLLYLKMSLWFQNILCFSYPDLR